MTWRGPFPSAPTENVKNSIKGRKPRNGKHLREKVRNLDREQTIGHGV